MDIMSFTKFTKEKKKEKRNSNFFRTTKKNNHKWGTEYLCTHLLFLSYSYSGRGGVDQNMTMDFATTINLLGQVGHRHTFNDPPPLPSW